jgi:3-hydroxybutyryl-CoA dehydratase
MKNLNVGSKYEELKIFTYNDIDTFSQLTGDENHIHLDDDFAKNKGFEGRICHGMLVSSYISKILAMDFPGTGTIYLNQFLSFKSPVYPNKQLKYCLTVKEANSEKRKYLIQTDVFHFDSGELALTGEALVLVR